MNIYRTRDHETEGANAFGSLVVMLVTWPLTAPFNGWVVSRLWDWFIVPVTGWPEIGVWHAAGISVFVTWMVTLPFQRDPNQRNHTPGETLGIVLGIVLAGLVTLGFGWIYLQLAGGAS